MTYKEALTQEMEILSKDLKVLFIGQGLTVGDRFYGTLKDVPLTSCLEMPIAENLIMGVAIGLAIKGWKPVVLFQRMDFMLIAADQIINHLALMGEMSNNQFNPKVIIRACIGSQSKHFEVGKQHNHDFRHVFSPYILTVDYKKGDYYGYQDHTKSVLIVEEKDLYESNIE